MTATAGTPAGPGSRGWAARLWDRAVHRILYSLLMAAVAVAIATLVVPPMRDYTGPHEQVIALVVLMLVVVEFAGTRLRRLVDWLLYGQRHDPASASAMLARPLRDTDDEHALEALLAALAETLRLTFVSVALPGTAEVTTIGREGPETVAFPIRRAGRDHGELRAARRGQRLD